MVDPSPPPLDANAAPEPPPAQPDIAAMRGLVKDAFSGKGLYRFARDHADFREACDRVSDPPSLDDMTDALLDYSEERLLLAKLLGAIWAINPDQAEAHFPELRDRAPARPPRKRGYPPPGGYGQPVRVGLYALVELVQQDREARKAVVAFGADFEAARQHVDELIGCKFLHDQLHELEVRCYTPIVMEASRFPHHDGVVETLSHYEYNLQLITDNLSEFLEQTDCEMDETWWVRHIFEAQASLRGATSNLDAGLLKEALRQLRRVLTHQPTRINARLLATARSLRLPAMVETMRYMRDSLVGLDLDLEKVDRFRLGVEALADLEQNLAALVDEHDRWQRLDLDLRRVEAVMDLDTQELEMSWPDLKAMIGPLYMGRSENWATRFRESINDLDSAIESENPRLIRQRFRQFCRHASDRFYRVDKDLKEQCEDLGKVGEPLALVLRMLE